MEVVGALVTAVDGVVDQDGVVDLDGEDPDGADQGGDGAVDLGGADQGGELHLAPLLRACAYCSG